MFLALLRATKMCLFGKNGPIKDMNNEQSNSDAVKEVHIYSYTDRVGALQVPTPLHRYCVLRVTLVCDVSL